MFSCLLFPRLQKHPSKPRSPDQGISICPTAGMGLLNPTVLNGYQGDALKRHAGTAKLNVHPSPARRTCPICFAPEAAHSRPGSFFHLFGQEELRVAPQQQRKKSNQEIPQAPTRPGENKTFAGSSPRSTRRGLPGRAGVARGERTGEQRPRGEGFGDPQLGPALPLHQQDTTHTPY